MSNLNISSSESSDSNASDLSEIGRSVAMLTVNMEREGTLASVKEESRDSSSHSQTSGAERLSKEEWSRMTKTQRRNFLRRRASKSKDEVGAQRPEGSGKRRREDAGFTPSPNKEERKRPKTEAPKYSHMLSCVKVAIVPNGHPKEELTEINGNRLAEKLVEILRTYDQKEGCLTFCGFVVRSGALVINCGDEKSKKWMIDAIDKLGTWEGMQLRTCDPKDLEGFVRITAFVPNPVKGVEEALGNLKTQGCLATEKWKILPGGVKKQPRGLFFVASIPESHYKTLEARNFRISCGLNLIEIKKLKEKKTREAAGTEVPEKKKEVERREEDVALKGAEGAAASGPTSEAAAVPDCPDSGKRSERPHQQPGSWGKPVAGGERQDAASASKEDTNTVGVARVSREQTGSDPPTS